MHQLFNNISITGWNEEHVDLNAKSFGIHLSLSASPPPEWIEAFRQDARRALVSTTVSGDEIVLELPREQLTSAQRYVDDTKMFVERANRTHIDALYQEDEKRRAEDAAKERVRQLMRLVRF